MSRIDEYASEIREKGYVIPADAKDALSCCFGASSRMSMNAENAFSKADYARLFLIMDEVKGEFPLTMENCVDEIMTVVKKCVDDENEVIGSEPFPDTNFDPTSLTIEQADRMVIKFYKDGVQFGAVDIDVHVNEKYMDNEYNDAIMPGNIFATSIEHGLDWEQLDRLSKAAAKEIETAQEECDDFAAGIESISVANESLSK